MNWEEIQEQVGSLECPINWNLEKSNKGNAAKKILQRSDTRNEKGNDSSTWQEICHFLCLAYLDYHASDEDDKMNDHLKHIEDICVNRKGTDSLIDEHSPSVDYVTNAMWAHYFLKKKNIEEVKKFLTLLPPFQRLSSKGRAGIFAIKSCCVMAFGPHESTEALKAIKAAVELDPEEAEWNFLNGKCLARTRRWLNFRSRPTNEELECLMKAVEKERESGSHYVFCALSYQERGLNDRNPAVKKKYMDESFALFKLAAAYSFDSPTSLARIARGLMRNLHFGAWSPPPVLLTLIEYCVKRAYYLCPDSGLVNHVAANYYFKIKRGTKEKYLLHLKKAAFESGVYGAYINLFEMYDSHKQLIDIDVAANNFWEEFKDTPVDRFKALKPMAAYYVFLKKDNLKSIQYWKEWLQSPLNSDKDHRNNFFCKCDNLTVVISNQIRKALEENSAFLTSDEREEMRVFLTVVAESLMPPTPT